RDHGILLRKRYKGAHSTSCSIPQMPCHPTRSSRGPQTARAYRGVRRRRDRWSLRLPARGLLNEKVRACFGGGLELAKPESIPDEVLNLMAAKLRVMGEPTRLAVLRTLMAGESNVSQIVEE